MPHSPIVYLRVSLCPLVSSPSWVFVGFLCSPGLASPPVYGHYFISRGIGYKPGYMWYIISLYCNLLNLFFFFTLSGKRMIESGPVRTYFLGSGRLGIPVLSALASDSRIELLGVGSQCDKPYGRRKVVTPTQLCRHALEAGFTVDRVDSVNSKAFLSRLSALDQFCWYPFGQILRQELLQHPVLAASMCTPRCCPNIAAPPP